MARTPSTPIKWHVGPNGPEQCRAQQGNCPYGRHLNNPYPISFETDLKRTTMKMTFTRNYDLERDLASVREKANTFYVENGFYPDGWEANLNNNGRGMVSHYSPNDTNLRGLESDEHGQRLTGMSSPIKLKRQRQLLTLTYYTESEERVIRFEPRYYNEVAFDEFAQCKAERALLLEESQRRNDPKKLAELSEIRRYISGHIKDYYRGTALSFAAAVEPDKANEAAWSLGILKNSVNYGDLAALDVNTDYIVANVSDFFRFTPTDNKMYCETEAVFRSGGRDTYHYGVWLDDDIKTLRKTDPYTLKRLPDGRWAAEVNGQKMTMNSDVEMKAYILDNRHTLYNSEKVVQFIDQIYSQQARYHDSFMYERRKALASEGSPRPICLNPLFEKFGYYKPEGETATKTKLFSFLRGGGKR